MLSERTRAALLDIRRNIAAAQAFIDGVPYESFRSDLKTFYAVTRALEIISEASRRCRMTSKLVTLPSLGDPSGTLAISTGTATTMSKASFIWDTARDDLATLSLVVEAELAASDASPTQV